MDIHLHFDRGWSCNWSPNGKHDKNQLRYIILEVKLNYMYQIVVALPFETRKTNKQTKRI